MSDNCLRRNLSWCMSEGIDQSPRSISSPNCLHKYFHCSSHPIKSCCPPLALGSSLVPFSSMSGYGLPGVRRSQYGDFKKSNAVRQREIMDVLELGIVGMGVGKVAAIHVMKQNSP